MELKQNDLFNVLTSHLVQPGAKKQSNSHANFAEAVAKTVASFALCHVVFVNILLPMLVLMFKFLEILVPSVYANWTS